MEQVSSEVPRLSVDVFEPSAASRSVGAPAFGRREGDEVQVLPMRGEQFGNQTVNKWMAFEYEPSRYQATSAYNDSTGVDGKSKRTDDNGSTAHGTVMGASIAQRTAEWGLMVRTDVGEGSFLVVGASTSNPSGDGVRQNALVRYGSMLEESTGSEFLRVPQEIKEALATLQQTFVVSDATKPECPTAYASSGFFSITGYCSNEIIGKNCRFLQGPDTDQNEVAKIRKAIKEGKSYCGRLLNYKTDGTPFWNLLTITPIEDNKGKTIKFIGMQVEVSKYTDWVNVKALRPNGLPKPLIQYDSRHKVEALGSIIEVVPTLKDPRSHLLSRSHDISVKTEHEKLKLDYMLPGPAEMVNRGTPQRQISVRDMKSNSLHSVSRLETTNMSRKSTRVSLMGFKRRSSNNSGANENQEGIQPEILMTRDVVLMDSWERAERARDIRQGIDLATTLECVEKNFVITDPRLPDDPIVKATAENVDEAVRELPDANLRPQDLWTVHSQPVLPKPHRRDSTAWAAIKKITETGEKIGLNNFKPLRPLGCGDTGSVHLVELKGSGQLFAMKAMDKSMMLNRNKVHRACVEREIMSLLDHPFLPALYSSFQTPTHVCLITDFCPGGELFALLDKQPLKMFNEASARFYAADVVIGLEYLHCLGIIYRDLKPENILLQKDGHIVLSDFDLSFKTACKPQVIKHPPPKKRSSRSPPPPIFLAEPNTQSNSFIGSEEYIGPEIITGKGHSSAIDWWALGILLYEMLYGRTPFKGKNRKKTFANILHKHLTFPSSIPVSLAARQLIHALLNRDPDSRLGSNSGANEIKQHPFFREINWPLIRCMRPPPLDAPLELFGQEPVAADITWNDEGDHPIELF